MWAPAPPARSGGRPAPTTCGWCWRTPNAKPPSQTISKPWSRTAPPRSAPWAPTIPRYPAVEYRSQLSPQTLRPTSGHSRRRGHSKANRRIRSLVLYVDLVGSRQIWDRRLLWRGALCLVGGSKQPSVTDAWVGRDEFGPCRILFELLAQLADEHAQD